MPRLSTVIWKSICDSARALYLQYKFSVGTAEAIDFFFWPMDFSSSSQQMADLSLSCYTLYRASRLLSHYPDMQWDVGSLMLIVGSEICSLIAYIPLSVLPNPCTIGWVERLLQSLRSLASMTPLLILVMIDRIGYILGFRRLIPVRMYAFFLWKVLRLQLPKRMLWLQLPKRVLLLQCSYHVNSWKSIWQSQRESE